MRALQRTGANRSKNVIPQNGGDAVAKIVVLEMVVVMIYFSKSGYYHSFY
jgi:hypothetical protein